MEDNKKIANLFYEIGTLRKISRSHRQTLFINDNADNIGSHSHRVSCIAWFLAKMESVDPYKTVMMSLFHDVPETRTGDQNWVHKRYVRVDESKILHDQFKDLPFNDLFEILSEYDHRESLESIVAKDADLLDQILLLKEYEHSGNKEATIWLRGKNGDETNKHLARLKTDSAKKLGLLILETTPSDWWKSLWTDGTTNS